ncbi:TPA: transposase [Vibrio parahaemolyticus]|nr:transposase [Vibrio parahaemolyticus]HCH3386248.1 transposase [Vibrio parahaemolyticus]HCH5494926.1 transposase [Vibrio parahaemolyticus]HCH5889239.1 transposase [Vibrio parahaemolyticus]HCH6276301.1 transposase [Vibrio parahaemolyticus]
MGLGNRRKRKSYTDETRLSAAKQYLEGVKVATIAEAHGCSQMAIYYWVQQFQDGKFDYLGEQ